MFEFGTAPPAQKQSMATCGFLEEGSAAESQDGRVWRSSEKRAFVLSGCRGSRERLVAAVGGHQECDQLARDRKRSSIAMAAL